MYANGKPEVVLDMFWTSPCVESFWLLFFGGMKWINFLGGKCCNAIWVFADLYRLSNSLAQHGWACSWFLDLPGTINYVILVQISVPKSFKACDGSFAVFFTPLFWLQSGRRVFGGPRISATGLRCSWNASLRTKTGRLLWVQANIIFEQYTQVISHVHRTCLMIWHDLTQDLGKDWNQELEVSGREWVCSPHVSYIGRGFDYVCTILHIF